MIPTLCEIASALDAKIDDRTQYVPDASVSAYQAAAVWSDHAGKILPLSAYVL